ncbi:SLC2A4 regulator isoform X3 [Peromyscus maniculatus bairdii]|uniref:SLC2A4 regulator isoform X3 n=1 Tax=Peromyscus maniculatus bairdii TaxID=230844 RepID=UPI003FCFC200
MLPTPSDHMPVPVKRIWLGALEGGQPCLLHSLHQPRCPQKQPTFCLGGHPEKKEELSSGHVPVPVEELWGGLSTASGMQRHVHLVHLGCSGTGGLVRVGSGLARIYALTLLFLAGDRQSQSRMMEKRTSTTQSWMLVCHSDQAYQQGEATDEDWGQVSEHSREKQNRGCDSFQRCLAPNHLEPQPTEAQAYIPALSAKLGVILEALG